MLHHPVFFMETHLTSDSLNIHLMNLLGLISQEWDGAQRSELSWCSEQGAVRGADSNMATLRSRYPGAALTASFLLM